MVTIQITETVSNNTELVYLLQHIAKLIDQGFTRGFDPNWKFPERKSLRMMKKNKSSIQFIPVLIAPKTHLLSVKEWF